MDVQCEALSECSTHFLHRLRLSSCGRVGGLPSAESLLFLRLSQTAKAPSHSKNADSRANIIVDHCTDAEGMLEVTFGMFRDILPNAYVKHYKPRSSDGPVSVWTE